MGQAVNNLDIFISQYTDVGSTDSRIARIQTDLTYASQMQFININNVPIGQSYKHMVSIAGTTTVVLVIN